MYVNKKLGKDDQVKFYAKQLAEIYGSYPSGKLLEDEEFVNALKIELKPIVEKTKSNFDTVYINSINNLFNKDESINQTDSALALTRTYGLLEEIKKRGYPSKDKVGYIAYRNALRIFFHAGFDVDNQLLEDVLLEAVGRGELSPSNYAEIIDKRCNDRNLPLVYHQMPFGYEDISEAEKVKVRAEREKIGLRSIEKSLKTITFPNGDTQTIMLD